MEEMKNHWKKWVYWFLLGVAIIIVYKLFDNFQDVMGVVHKFLDIIAPFFAGIFRFRNSLYCSWLWKRGVSTNPPYLCLGDCFARLPANGRERTFPGLSNGCILLWRRR